jgi:hypothetical protein
VKFTHVSTQTVVHVAANVNSGALPLTGQWTAEVDNVTGLGVDFANKRGVGTGTASAFEYGDGVAYEIDTPTTTFAVMANTITIKPQAAVVAYGDDYTAAETYSLTCVVRGRVDSVTGVYSPTEHAVDNGTFGMRFVWFYWV